MGKGLRRYPVGGTGRRLRSRRAVLEGLPLSMIISVIIIAVGTIALLTIFSYANGQHLSSVSLSTGSPPSASVNGFLYCSASSWFSLTVTAYSEAGNVLPGVRVAITGSGYGNASDTAANGSATFFLPPPTLAEHATSGEITVTATYTPGLGIGGGPETVTSQVEVLE